MSRRLAQLLRRERVDLVHARSRAPAWVALAATRRHGVPFVTTFHGIYSGRSPIKLNYNSVMARGDVVIANSGFHRASTSPKPIRARASASPSSIAASTSGGSRAARSTDARAAPARGLAVAPHEQIVLLPARVSGRKGHRVLIEAAALLKAAGRRTTSLSSSPGRESRQICRANSTA